MKDCMVLLEKHEQKNSSQHNSEEFWALAIHDEIVWFFFLDVVKNASWTTK